MVTEEDVLKAIVKHHDPDGKTNYLDVMEKLSMDDISLIPFLKAFEEKGYITRTMEDVTITSLGLSAYSDIKPINKAKKSIYNFSKFTLQRLIDIIIGIVIGVIVAYIVYHFGWQ